MIPRISRKSESACESLWDSISAYADGSASAAEIERIERHCSGCKACAGHLRFLRETAQILAATPEVAPPPGLRHAILAATIYRPTFAVRARQFARRYATATVSSLAVAGAAALILAAFLSKRTPLIPPASPEGSGDRRVIALNPTQNPQGPSTGNGTQTQNDRTHISGPATSISTDVRTHETTSAPTSPHTVVAVNTPAPSRAAQKLGPALVKLASLTGPRIRQNHRIPRDAFARDRVAPSSSTKVPRLVDVMSQQRDDDSQPADMLPADMKTMMPTDMDDMSPMGDPMGKSASAAAATAPPRVHITLASATTTPPPSTVLVTLADLRQRLRRQNDAALDDHQELHLRKHDELISILKGSF